MPTRLIKLTLLAPEGVTIRSRDSILVPTVASCMCKSSDTWRSVCFVFVGRTYHIISIV